MNLEMNKKANFLPPWGLPFSVDTEINKVASNDDKCYEGKDNRIRE